MAETFLHEKQPNKMVLCTNHLFLYWRDNSLVCLPVLDILLKVENLFHFLKQWRDFLDQLKVYAVHRRFEGTPNEVTRHTLTIARDGKLKKADIDNLVKLARICSELSGEKLTVNDILKMEQGSHGYRDDIRWSEI